MDICCSFSWLLLLIFILPFVALKLVIWWRIRHRRKTDRQNNKGAIVRVAFFHPYCHAGGGGERVLWCSVNALLERYQFVRCHVFTGDSATGEEILRRARQRFNLKVPNSVEFVHLKSRNLVEASTWPCFTLLGQSIGSLALGFEALWKFTPDVYIDSMGYAFTLPLFKWLGGCRVGCYVHYPTISTDMLGRVSQREAAFNNASFIARSRILSAGKLLYYRMFAYIYGVAGRRADVVMVNSSWTKDHIMSLWKIPELTAVVYPPCDTSGFSANPLKPLPDRSTLKHLVVSVAQFRPEKNHALQLEAFALFHKNLHLNSKDQLDAELVLVGGCRNEGDQQRVDELRVLARKLNIEKSVRFELNASYDLLRDFLCSATIGLHTMVNEHFGIGVVECMAAGAVTLAHESAGPKMDIVVEWRGQPTGFLASTVEEYADKMMWVLCMTEQERDNLRQHARLSARRFDDQTFASAFISRTEKLVRLAC
ncbi:GDP-Man:Man(3)GlcNAc(2)-PP-Dol alpha-1,2-mannosyltransferase-like [Sycon ciliatum]|uniref:GDP-Man:Man(3)GlcNAc(2)-PP-Dol alpha-1,2-mannosyltransferase-like n=1 Tax=Sycon ciliatum TaxID=27933 RepID=UPI0020ADC105|eukprot:scpid72148/ scgid12115/ GDP-Man:Man(3)GlcNAc(2)-PP-Dol alpha-1,2-mannosyltransferase; Asparagine-linked glycosylation protein 11 homolog; Glycolipid 2-alpha-mannosyltransferase